MLGIDISQDEEKNNLSCFNLLKVQDLCLDLASEKTSPAASIVLHPIHPRCRCTKNL